MVQNLDKIISDLKFVNEKLINRLDKIEPVLAKDKYQIEDVDFLKSVDFQVERFESFIEILLPLLETDDEGVLLKKSLISSILSFKCHIRHRQGWLPVPIYSILSVIFVLRLRIESRKKGEVVF